MDFWTIAFHLHASLYITLYFQAQRYPFGSKESPWILGEALYYCESIGSHVMRKVRTSP